MKHLNTTHGHGRRLRLRVRRSHVEDHRLHSQPIPRHPLQHPNEHDLISPLIPPVPPPPPNHPPPILLNPSLPPNRNRDGPPRRRADTGRTQREPPSGRDQSPRLCARVGDAQRVQGARGIRPRAVAHRGRLAHAQPAQELRPAHAQGALRLPPRQDRLAHARPGCAAL